MKFTDKTVFLSGAASGFGRLAAVRLAAEGANLALCDVNGEGLESLAADLAKFPVQLLYETVDVCSIDGLANFFARIDAEFNRIDVAVNNAGVAHRFGPLHECSFETWNRIIEINLTGTFLCMQNELSRMKDTGGGVILNVASLAGVLGAPMLGAYSAAKHGVVGLTRTAAAEYGPRGIRTNALCPGFSPTPLVDTLMTDVDNDTQSRIFARIPLGRMGSPEEIVAAMVWLCSEENSFMNGAEIVLDGGLKSC